MEYFVIGDEDTVLGFSLVGVSGIAASSADEVKAAWDKALEDKGHGVIIITRDAADRIRETVDRYLFSESFPLCYEDTPVFGVYKDACVARYQEGLDVGYRYYDTYAVPVAFPFGHGLSYACFAYSDLKVECGENTVRVRFFVENTSDTDGKEIVQLYVRPVQTFVYRPEKELKRYAKVCLKAGEKKEVCFELSQDAFAYWSTAVDGWRTDDGLYELLVGASSRDIRLTAKIGCERGGFFPCGRK